MAIDMFLKLDTLNGESEDAAFPGWVDVLAWSLGGSQSGTAGAGGGMGGGKVAIQDLSFTKYTDILTPKLWGQMCTGAHYPEVKFNARKAGGEPFVYQEITLNDVIVTSVSTGGSGGEDRTTENVTLNFKKFKIEYIKQGPDGKEAGRDDFTFNVATNAKES